jgi:hypothetical protein
MPVTGMSREVLSEMGELTMKFGDPTSLAMFLAAIFDFERSSFEQDPEAIDPEISFRLVVDKPLLPGTIWAAVRLSRVGNAGGTWFGPTIIRELENVYALMIESDWIEEFVDARPEAAALAAKGGWGPRH